MAESSFAAASTSTATATATATYYDVFINHRGPDVKKTLASHLYRRLLSCGLRVFLDQPELQRGDCLNRQIEDAIRSASVHVAIFSARYADSIWCLKELVQMLDSKAPIIPVFYHVEPTELRWTQGIKTRYAEALEKLERKTEYDPQTHEQKLRYDSSQIENWRKTLSKVAGISGFELEACNRDEGELVEKVVELVLKKVKKPALYVAKYPTGLDETIKDFENTVLQQLQQSRKPQILGIVGLGGVGKTTMAKEFFNRKNSDYRESCFLSDVRDKDCLISLQKKLLRSLNVSDMIIERVDSVDEGKGILRSNLPSAKALVILDDVDDVDQVDALLPVQTVLSDCLILITSRKRDVLISSKIEESSIYKLTELDRRHSLELFCSHAFNQPDPLPGFESMVQKFLEACNGLPLSLKVYGALLYGKELSLWEDELRSSLPTEIQHILKRSYNSLNREEQNIFLDIACFLRGQNKDRAIRIWDGSRWQGRKGFQNLMHRCLVEVDNKNDIQMHDHLRDMGRDIAEDPGLPCRLWRWTENAIDDLLRLPLVRAVRGIRMALSENNDIDGDCALGDIRMKRLQLLDTEDVLVERILTKVHSPNLIWLRWNNCPHSSLSFSISVKNLWVLQVRGRKLKKLWENESQAPLQLRELEIEGPLSNIPKSIGQLKHLERIVIGPIDESGSVVPLTTDFPDEESSRKSHLKRIVIGPIDESDSVVPLTTDFPDEESPLQPFDKSGSVVPLITKLPEEFCLLQSLKALVLKECLEMKSLPDSFGDLTNLHHIQLSNCRGLEKLPDSFGELIKLQYLDLNNCTNLTMSRETLRNTSMLEYINLTGCEKIEVLPLQMARQKRLKQLSFGGTNVKKMPSAIGKLSDLEVVGVGGPLLDTLPASLGDLRNLKKLGIWRCKALKCLPPSLRLLTQLTELRVVSCPLIRELPFKKKVKGDNCILPRLQEIYVQATGISEVSFAEGVCCNLRRLEIFDCHNVVEVGTLPNTLTSLVITHCHNLRKIDKLYCLAKLEELELSKCIELEELPRMETLVSLSRFMAHECVKLKSIRGLGQLTKLRIVLLNRCFELEEVESIQDCMSLQRFYTIDCPKVQWNAEAVEQLSQRCSISIVIH